MAWYNVGLRARLAAVLGVMPPTPRAGSLVTNLSALARLRDTGYAPKAIYDVGAFRGTWTAETRGIFPDATYFLFEANDGNADALSSTGERFFIAALADVDHEKRPLFLPHAESAWTGVSLYRERSSHFSDDKVAAPNVEVRRLDKLANEHGLPQPDLLKVDVQGAELDVIKGAGSMIAGCSAILLETSLLSYNEGAPLISDVLAFMSSAGFYCVDITEVHRAGADYVIQLDVLCVREDIYDAYRSKAGLLTSLHPRLE